MLENRYKCFQGSSRAGGCDGTPVGLFNSPEQCCDNASDFDYEDPSGTCFSCANNGGKISRAIV